MLQGEDALADPDGDNSDTTQTRAHGGDHQRIGDGVAHRNVQKELLHGHRDHASADAQQSADEAVKGADASGKASRMFTESSTDKVFFKNMFFRIVEHQGQGVESEEKHEKPKKVGQGGAAEMVSQE